MVDSVLCVWQCSHMQKSKRITKKEWQSWRIISEATESKGQVRQGSNGKLYTWASCAGNMVYVDFELKP